MAHSTLREKPCVHERQKLKEGCMKYFIPAIILLTMNILFCGCATSPYLKTDDLPSTIHYYNTEKQFKLNPEWYWRLRPSKDSVENYKATIGHNYLKNKNGPGLIVGECNSEEKYYVVKWNDYGYYFIREKDYLFAGQFKKYIVPLNYESDSFRHGHEYLLIAYYQENSSPYIGDMPAKIFSDATRSGLNLTVILKLTLNRSLMMNRKNIYNTKYSSIINNAVQISSRAGFTNEFLKFTSCPLFYEFSKDELMSSIECLAVEKIGTKQYTNQYGVMFMGILYQTKFIVVKWGKVFYAFPCE